MTTPLILSSSQAQELHTTGRLSYREKCEWQPPKGASVFEIDDWDAYWKVHYCLIADPEVELNDVQKLTPPRDTDTTYAVLEPCELASSDSNRFFVCYDGGVYDEKEGAEWHETTPDDEWKQQLTEYGTWYIRDAAEMPDWAVRQHARITDIKLIISDGELWWDMDLEKVEG